MGGLQALMGLQDPPAVVRPARYSRGAELIERFRAAHDAGDVERGVELAGQLLADSWAGPVLEAAILRRIAEAAAGRAR